MFSRKTDERGCLWNQGGAAKAALINFVNLGKVNTAPQLRANMCLAGKKREKAADSVGVLLETQPDVTWSLAQARTKECEEAWPSFQSLV